MLLDGLVGYEIFVESFYDSNNDGIGDLKGITLKLDYLNDLGVNVLWLTPFMSSPQVDNGYDVSDYYQVDPRYGNNNDLIELINEAHKRDIKIMIDFVMNHTSSEHEWFKKSCLGIKPYDEYYIWRNKKNNWMGFCGDVWTYNEDRKQYYFHTFNKLQPDLNYHNPLVIEEMLKIAKFYLEMGVDGFRLDAVSHLEKEATFSNSRLCSKGIFDSNKYSNRKEVFEYLKPFKSLCEEYGAFIIGEVGGNASNKLMLKFTNRQDGVMDAAFVFNQCWMNDLYVVEDASEIGGIMFTAKRFIREYTYIFDKINAHSEMVNYWLNHDHPRLRSQYGDENDLHSLSALAALQYLLPGMPFIYYGEEIGMSNILYLDSNDFKDAYAVDYLKSNNTTKALHHLSRVNRDASRSVMEWDDSEYLGFSKVEPYRSIGVGKHVNGLRQVHDDKSLFTFYQKIIKLRRNPKYYFINHPTSFEIREILRNVVYYCVKDDGISLEVYVNLTPEKQKINISGTIILNNYDSFDTILHSYQVIVVENN